jgi:L,D-transpeptidase ErfK/SrfK
MTWKTWAGLPALLFGATLLAQTSEGRLVGGETPYTAKWGDSLARIAARFAVDAGVLARENGLPATARLGLGQHLRVASRHIVPFVLDEGILINVPQRLLFFFHEGTLAAWYPVGLGRPDWQTATGQFEVAAKEHEPTWDVPISIQKEMRRQGKPVRKKVPPGPDNPLGDYWIGLAGSPCGIHGTNAPESVYAFRTHGCVRLHPDDIADLFSRVSVGTPVWIAYEPVLLARREDGAIFLEVNRDVYRRTGNLRAAVDGMVAREGVLGILDPSRVTGVVAAREGVARRVDRIADTFPQETLHLQSDSCSLHFLALVGFSLGPVQKTPGIRRHLRPIGHRGSERRVPWGVWRGNRPS